MATASTMIPMPPSQLSRWRHRLMERGRNSRPESTVPPVVVRPEAASKYALGEIDRQVMPQRHACDGGQRNPGQRHQHQPVASLQLALEAPCREPQQRTQHERREPEMTNDQSAGSNCQIAMTSGASMVTANTIITMANTCATGSSMSFTGRTRSLETAFLPLRCAGGP